jgi:predicted Zn-dependent protease with MMP-like domain
MRPTSFERLVNEAVASLPDALRERLANVEIVVQAWPSREQLAEVGATRRDELFGLYEGIPLTERTSGYGMVLPDRIAIFREPILRACRTEEEVRAEVRQTVVHELAHHFGIDDDRLDELGAY